jgi:hypothetical protein
MLAQTQAAGVLPTWAATKDFVEALRRRA